MKNIVVISIILLLFGCSKDELPTVKDIDGNEYHYITIGSQVWMVENLKTSRYRNGDTIPSVTENTDWRNLTTGALCYYNNDSNNGKTYGILYNWYVLDDNRMVAPSGWRVATIEDWNTLINYLGGTNIAGGKLKETGTSHWISPNSDASNTINFSALPAGIRDNHGNFTQQRETAEWWIPKEYDSIVAWFTQIADGTSIQVSEFGHKNSGLSIRCVKE